MTGKSKEYYVGGAWITYFEQMQQLKGIENLLMSLAYRSKKVYRLQDDLLAFNLSVFQDRSRSATNYAIRDSMRHL